MKAGIFVVAELGEPVREKILEVQRWADPRLAAGTPPHVTMVGSSGVGPLPLGTPVEIMGAAHPGTLVYNSWLAMQGKGETDPVTKAAVPMGLTDEQIADIVAYLQALK